MKVSPAEKLTVVQKHLAEGHEGAKQIFESMGYYLGYAIAHYADFYDIKHVLILEGNLGSRGNIDA